MKRFNAMWMFIAVVFAGGIIAALLLGAHGMWSRFDVLVFVVLAGLAAGASTVVFPNVRIQFTVGDPVILCSLALLGPGPAMLTAVATVVGATLRHGSKATARRFIFNLGSQTLATGLAGSVFLLTGGMAGEPLRELLVPLLAATATLFIGDNGLVALVVAIEQDKAFINVWSDSFRWAAVSYFTGLSFATAIILLYESLGIMGFAFGLAPVWMLLSFLKIQKRWQAEHQNRMEQVEQMNRVLEWKVHERTQELQAALGTVEDTNSKLLVSNEALTEASKAKSEFLANISHELRTPLNAIIGFSEVLSAQDTEGLSSRQLDFLKAIHDGGDHLLSLINDILDLSKIESNRMPMNLDVVDVAAIVSEVVSMLQGQAEKNDLVLSAECEGGMGFVSVDQRLFREVLLNLMSNAIKFTPAGGSVRVLARMDDCDLVIQVVDTGIGISREDQAQVFEQFYQVDGTYTRKFRGTGLGLGLVRRMVEMHGGTVAVESELGEGATFICRFPDCHIDRPEETQEPILPARSTAPSAREGQRTILVVDSDPLSRRLAVNALKTKNYRVLEAIGCSPALDILRVQHVDLALVALKMDGTDGYTLAREVMNEPATRTVSLVAMAGAETTDPEVIQESGFAGLIATPVQINRLPHQVRSYLERKEHVA